MEMGSINSGNNAYVNLARPTSENRQAEQAKEAQKLQQPTQVKTEKQVQVQAQQEAPKPVVNAQGQQTGTRINVTA